MFALVKELVLSINEKAPLATLLLKNPITNLESIFCIIGSIILLVAICIFDATCQISKKNVVLSVLLATCIHKCNEVEWYLCCLFGCWLCCRKVLNK